MKIACIGNYPPRECGIATFTRDFMEAVKSAGDKTMEENETYVIAMNDQPTGYDYPQIVTQEINRDRPQDYLKAVKYINRRNPDVCFLQHEFGIFGGNSGIYILPLIHRLNVPLIPIFHTVLKEPSYNERNVIIEIGREAAKIVVMNKLAIGILSSVYDIPEDKIVVIPHGVPEFDFSRKNYHRGNLKLDGKKTLLTFGFLSRNKGLETVINALPQVVNNHPDLLYIILGKTHPTVQKKSGEEYRNYLKLLVRKNGLLDNVFFDDSYIETRELLGYLCAADLYVTPYLNEAQITSGTLAYAVGAGTAVISTPYLHARELLADGRGLLFDFNDSEGLAEILNDLLDNPAQLQELKTRACEYGKLTFWPEVGKRYRELCTETIGSYRKTEETPEWGIKQLLLPQFKMDHIEGLTDSTGILQHAKYNIPSFKDGYCLDDNARALLMSVMAYRQLRDTSALQLMPHYLSYIQYMQNEDGSFRNFLSYDGRFLDDEGSEDSFGRTIWALGYMIRYAPSEAFLEIGVELFGRSYGKIGSLGSLRGIANSIVGLYHWNKRYTGDENALELLKELTSGILLRYREHNSDDWHWFETSLTYDNGMIPYALMCAFELTEDAETLAIAQEAMGFLEGTVLQEGYLSPVGTEKWFRKGEQQAKFDQQPINAMSVILMYQKAYEISQDKGDLKKMFDSFMWFLGENDLRVPLYDFETRGCNDGLKSYGVNRNQGAESTLAYLISYLTVFSYYEFSD